MSKTDKEILDWLDSNLPPYHSWNATKKGEYVWLSNTLSTTRRNQTFREVAVKLMEGKRGSND